MGARNDLLPYPRFMPGDAPAELAGTVVVFSKSRATTDQDAQNFREPAAAPQNLRASRPGHGCECAARAGRLSITVEAECHALRRRQVFDEHRRPVMIEPVDATRVLPPRGERSCECDRPLRSRCARQAMAAARRVCPVVRCSARR
jgi:hypothetical protein